MSERANRLDLAREAAAIEYEKAAANQVSLTVIALHRGTAARIRAGQCDHNVRVRHHLAEQSA